MEDYLMKNKHKPLTAIVLISIFVVSSLSFALILERQSSSLQAEPLSADGSIEIGVQEGDYFIYRITNVSTDGELQSDAYLRRTVTQIEQDGNDFTVTSDQEFAVGPDFTWELDQDSPIVDTFENDDVTTWLGDVVTVANLDTDDPEIRNLLKELPDEDATIQEGGEEFGEDYFQFEGSYDVNGVYNDWNYTAILDLDLGLPIFVEEYIEEHGTEIFVLVDSSYHETDESSGVEPGDTLSYMDTMENEHFERTIEYVYREYTGVDEQGNHPYLVVVVADDSETLGEFGRYCPEGSSLIMERQDGPSRIISQTIDDLSPYEGEIEDLFAEDERYNEIDVNADGLYLNIDLLNTSNDNAQISELRFNDAGLMEFYREIRSDGGEDWELEGAFFLYEGPGVLDSADDFEWLNVDVGDSWEFLSFEDKETETGEEHDETAAIEYMKYEVTDIFTLNGSGAVFGNIMVSYERGNYELDENSQGHVFIISDGDPNSLDFMDSHDYFYDTFFPEEHHRDQRGPPALFPTTLDIESLGDQLFAMLEENWETEPIVQEIGDDYILASNYDDTYWYTQISDDGIMNVYESRFRFDDEETFIDNFESMYLTETSWNETPDAIDLGVEIGTEIHTERVDEDGWNRTRIQHITDIIPTISGRSIIVGEITYEDNGESWEREWYHADDENQENPINSWIIGTPGLDDPLGLFASDNILPVELVNDFEAYEDDVFWILNSLFVPLEEGDLSIEGRTISIEAAIGEADTLMRIHYNEKGIMQHQYVIAEDEGEVVQWNADVLSAGPGETGQYFWHIGDAVEILEISIGEYEGVIDETTITFTLPEDVTPEELAIYIHTLEGVDPTLAGDLIESGITLADFSETEEIVVTATDGTTTTYTVEIEWEVEEDEEDEEEVEEILDDIFDEIPGYPLAIFGIISLAGIALIKRRIKA